MANMLSSVTREAVLELLDDTIMEKDMIKRVSVLILAEAYLFYAVLRSSSSTKHRLL